MAELDPRDLVGDVIGAVLAELPDDEMIAGFDHAEGPEWKFARPIAKRAAVTLVRLLSDRIDERSGFDSAGFWLDRLADGIEAAPDVDESTYPEGATNGR